jgi:pyruvate kinase
VRVQAHEERVRDERTKVVATLGPASGDPALLGRMLDAGLDVVRLNFSHGTGEEHLKRMAMVRGVSAERGGRTAILADLQGPKIRVGLVPPEGIQLDRDEQCELVAGAESAPSGSPWT